MCETRARGWYRAGDNPKRRPYQSLMKISSISGRSLRSPPAMPTSSARRLAGQGLKPLFLAFFTSELPSGMGLTRSRDRSSSLEEERPWQSAPGSTRWSMTGMAASAHRAVVEYDHARHAAARARASSCAGPTGASASPAPPDWPSGATGPGRSCEPGGLGRLVEIVYLVIEPHSDVRRHEGPTGRR